MAPAGPLAQDILGRLGPPSAKHWLGSDQFGRDTFGRILYGYRASLGVSVGAVLLALVIGGTLGTLAAYFGGWFDRIVMRLMDVLLAFPVILLAIGIVAVLGQGQLNTALAIGIVYIPTFARLLRGPALILKESEYVSAAHGLGANDARIVFRHILPNLTAVILVQTSVALSTAILVEASLSFLGLGTQPPNPSLGLMLSESRSFLTLATLARRVQRPGHLAGLAGLQSAGRQPARHPRPEAARTRLKRGHLARRSVCTSPRS